MPKKTNEQSAWMKFVLHIHPPKLAKQSLNFTRTFGLGGISALLFVVLGLTGALLRFKYVPSIDGAYHSIIAIENSFVFGRLLRNLHYWSANLMILVVVLHLLRVFFSNSIFYERAKNWQYGILMLILTLAFAFTGYLLTWDQLSYWAVTIMFSLIEYIPWVGKDLSIWIMGGEEIGQQALLSFYTLHTGVLPLFFIILMMIHFYLVRAAKGITYTLKPKEEKELVPSTPNLIRIEATAALFVFVLLLVLSTLFDAPLKEMANPELTPNPSKAPWYFIGLQEALLHFHPLIVILIPIIALFGLIRMPKIACSKDKVGIWFGGEENKKDLLIWSVFGLVWSFLIAIVDDVLRITAQLNTESWYGVLIFVIYLSPLVLIYLKSRKKNISLFIMSMFCFLSTGYIAFSIIAYALRGEGMKLIFL